MLVSINKSLRNLLLKSTIVVVTFFLNVFLWYRSYKYFTSYFKNLKKTPIVVYVLHHSKKICVAWYWNLRNELCCISKYLQEHYTRCITRAALFLKMYQVLFQRDTSSKSNCNRSFRGQPAGWNCWLLWCVHLHVFFSKKRIIRYKGLSLNTHFYMGPYFSFFRFIGITFNNVTFLFNLTMTMVLETPITPCAS